MKETLDRAFAGGASPLQVKRYMVVPDAPYVGARALDVCCGTGYGSMMLARKAYFVTALDKWGGAGPLLRGAGIELIVADMYRMPEGFPYDWFDVIVANEAIEHLQDPSAALRMFRQWLMPGGAVHVTIPIDKVAKSANPFHLHTFTREAARALVEECFTVECEYPIAGAGFVARLRARE